MVRRKRLAAVAGLSAMSAIIVLHPLVAYAECYCNLTEPVDVIVKNWQTFQPKVTAMHSLNAYIANQLGQEVYYVPTLDMLPNVRNRMYNCTDFRGTNQKFAAIYDGYFDVECQDVLLKRPNGEYTKVPAMMKAVEPGSERELTILGYDYLLTRESIRDVVTNGTAVSLTYQTDKLDLRSGSVDVRTAIMDIYKAIGQEVQETTYVFTEDPTLTLETSPIQKEIHLQMAQNNSIDVSAGAGYVFTTRTNPDLYWEKAERDHIVTGGDVNSSTYDSLRNPTATHTLTLAEFCSYAYNIMGMYGEPVMTTSEKSILLQLYGTSVPYKGVDDYAIEAIENFIAKGIISPDDDQSNMNWNAPITPKYMLTLLMRIADVDSRMTYKDVEITINPTLLDQNWYAAGVNVESSPILKLEEDKLYAKVATYTENRFAKSKVISDLGAHKYDEFYIQNHLVVHKPSTNEYFPLGVLVKTTPDLDDRGNPYDYVSMYQKDGDSVAVTTPFGECLKWEGGENGKLRINIYIKRVRDFMQDDGTYHIHLQQEDGTPSSGYLQVAPGKSADESTPNRGTSSSRDDEDEEEEDDWEDYEEDEEDWYDEPGVNLASTQSAVVMMEITPGTEADITFKAKVGGARKTLAEIMQSDKLVDGYGYLIPNDATEIHAKKVSDTLYQVEGVESLREFQSQVSCNTSKATPIEGFVNRDTELIVSTDWLKEAGFIVDFNTEQGNENVLVLKSSYNEIYLDKSKKIIVTGTTVYSLQNLKEDEIFSNPKAGTYYVNFRAVMGWTGDFMLFKDSGNGTVTVSVSEYPKSVNGSKNALSNGRNGPSLRIDMKRVEDKTSPISGLFSNTEMSQSIQGFNSTNKGQYSKKVVSMAVTYPYANWMIYSRGALGETVDATDNDWLFVFKPKRVKINGKEIEYDDSASRQIFTSIMGPKDMSQDLISIWAYPLYRGKNDRNPEGFTWDESLGWIYEPQVVSDSYDFLVQYLDGTKTYNGDTGSGKATSPIPLVVVGDNIICMNLNSYSVNKNGQEELLEYGTIPVVALRPLVGSDGTVKSISGSLKKGAEIVTTLVDAIHNPFTGGKVNKDQTVGSVVYNTIENAIDALSKEYYCGINNSGAFEIRRNTEAGVSMENCKVYPTVVSPALWTMDLQQYDFEWIKQNYANCKILTGTDLIQIIKLKDGSIQVWQGNTKLDEDEFSKKKFLRIRNSNANGSREYIFSESQLTSFTLNSDSTETLDENRTVETLSVGRASSHIDVIDWDEFTLKRLLEDFEFGVAITMVIVLYIIPRVCLFVFLMLLSLAVIQNVKLVQWFCDRVFDPYKFLTMGRRNVHTFRPGIAFRNSIIAMAIFALFMDGTIIHFFEWIVQFLAYIFSYH